MKKLISIATLASMAIAPAANAQEAASASASPEDFMRSSIYTVLIQSDEQDQILEEEARKESSGATLIKSFADTDAKRAANSDSVSISKSPQYCFLEIPIPDQFNDHNLGIRIINLEEWLANATDADQKAAEAFVPKKKKGGFGSMLGKVAAQSVNLDLPARNFNEKFDKVAPVAMYRFLKENHIGDSLVAKWYNYGVDANVWDQNLIIARGRQDLSEADKEQARLRGMEDNETRIRGRKLVENTYLVMLNLRFRSNQAIVAEAEAVADALAGSKGGLSLLAAGASAAAGEGFQVGVEAYLFHLVWNKEIETKFAEDIFSKKASLQDLINSGLCKLEYIGKEKSSARVRQSITNTTPQNVLIRRATERAIDNAYAKLQEKYDIFRTAFPVSKSENGMVYARVGMKEGIEKGDEYEILEQQEDKEGNLIWKQIATVKAVDKQIWDNRAGAVDDRKDMSAEEAEKEVDYTSLGQTAFQGGKKNQDYTGYYLRLKKKK